MRLAFDVRMADLRSRAGEMHSWSQRESWGMGDRDSGLGIRDSGFGIRLRSGRPCNVEALGFGLFAVLIAAAAAVADARRRRTRFLIPDS